MFWFGRKFCIAVPIQSPGDTAFMEKVRETSQSQRDTSKVERRQMLTFYTTLVDRTYI